jgi:ankyrin repeat protein
VAAALGFPQVAEALLALGANASARDFDDVTPTMMAGQRGHREVVRLLLDAGGVVGGRDEDLPRVVAQELMRRLLK